MAFAGAIFSSASGTLLVGLLPPTCGGEGPRAFREAGMGLAFGGVGAGAFRDADLLGASSGGTGEGARPFLVSGLFSLLEGGKGEGA